MILKFLAQLGLLSLMLAALASTHVLLAQKKGGCAQPQSCAGSCSVGTDSGQCDTDINNNCMCFVP